MKEEVRKREVFTIGKVDCSVIRDDCFPMFDQLGITGSLEY